VKQTILFEIEFALAFRGIVDAWHIRFMDFQEVAFLHNRLKELIDKEQEESI
jgi:hypothetical protein